MTTRSSAIHNNQSAINYINKKGINELFEAMMTALMVNKPDDHISYIRECLDKVQHNPQRLRWDFFVSTSPNSSKTTSLNRSTPVKPRQKALPPVRPSNSLSRANQKSDYRTVSKSLALPPIENTRKTTDNQLPIVFILSSDSSTNLCSKLIERYNQIEYLYINDIANIDEDENIDLKKYEHRFDAVQRVMEQRRSIAQGYLITGHLDEKNFGKKWLEKLGRIDLIILLSSNRQPILNQNLRVIYIESHHEFDTMLAKAIHAVDEIFPLNTLSNDYFRAIENKFNHMNIPIIFCIDNYHGFNEVKVNGRSLIQKRMSIDAEFDLTANDDDEDETNNSFIHTLCQRLGEQFSYKHIHYDETNKSSMTFEQLKSMIIESMSTVTGFIIDHFPTSLDDLERFQTEIGPCSVLIYIGEHQIEGKDDDLNAIVEKFKRKNKAIYIDCRMEVDEIYEDLKNDILKQI